MNKRRPVLLLILGAALAVPWPAAAESGDTEIRVDERIDWTDPGLELYLWSVREHGDRVELRFRLGLRDGADVASTHVGYPRYSDSPHAWRDAVLVGLAGRNRVVRASRHGPSDRVLFSVLVPRHAEWLRLPVGSEVLELDLVRWLRLTEEEVRVPLRWIGPVAEEEQPPPPVSEPGLPVQLLAAVRWVGDKPFGDGALDAEETGDLLVDVTNRGERATRGVRIRIQPSVVDGISFMPLLRVPVIEPGQTETVRIPFVGEPDLGDGTLRLTVQVLEEHGHDAVPIRIDLTTRARAAADLVLLDDFAVEGAALPLPRDRVVTVRLRLRNVGAGWARAAVARVEPEPGVFRAQEGAERFELGDLAPGAVAEIEYRCYANQRAESMDLRVEFSDVATRSDPSASTVSLPLEDSAGPSPVVRIRADAREVPDLPPAPAPLTSDVDRDVPRSLTSRPDALAVVIGVENYASAPPATFAADDARTASTYMERVLGVPAERILVALDGEVTLGQFQRVFGERGWLSRRMEAETEVFVFFAGHGTVDPGSDELYLLPRDADPDYVRQTGFRLDLMLESLAALKARNVTVFLDACFSGRSRQEGPLLAGVRPLIIVPDRSGVPGVSIYSAASGSQVAGTLDEQGHGLFTYHLFHGLGGAADVDGDRKVTASELQYHLETEVSRSAGLADREQTPSVFLDDSSRVLAEY